jgi:hypothetical protein
MNEIFVVVKRLELLFKMEFRTRIHAKVVDVKSLESLFERVFGEFNRRVYIADAYQSDNPEIWQKWWTNRIGNDVDDDDDGPWSYPTCVT